MNAMLVPIRLYCCIINLCWRNTNTQLASFLKNSPHKHFTFQPIEIQYGSKKEKDEAQN